jgi:hypothetical protein
MSGGGALPRLAHGAARSPWSRQSGADVYYQDKDVISTSSSERVKRTTVLF